MVTKKGISWEKMGNTRDLMGLNGDLMGKKRKLMGFSWEVKIFGHDAFIGEIEGNCECLEKYWI